MKWTSSAPPTSATLRRMSFSLSQLELMIILQVVHFSPSSKSTPSKLCLAAVLCLDITSKPEDVAAGILQFPRLHV